MKVISQILRKIGCHGNIPWDIKKWGPDQSSTPKMLSFGEKITKIGPADPEIICLREIIKDEKEEKKEIAEGTIYSPSGKFAERAKSTRQTMSVS